MAGVSRNRMVNDSTSKVGTTGVLEGGAAAVVGGCSFAGRSVGFVTLTAVGCGAGSGIATVMGTIFAGATDGCTDLRTEGIFASGGVDFGLSTALGVTFADATGAGPVFVALAGVSGGTGVATTGSITVTLLLTVVGRHGAAGDFVLLAQPTVDATIKIPSK
jgi:hypothetical protein